MNCFCLLGFGLRIQLKCSGENEGMPSYLMSFLLLMVSPIEKAPVLTNLAEQ